MPCRGPSRLAAVPADWDHDRASHIASAIKSLHQQVRVDGAVVDGKGATNLEATAAVAAGRQAVGLDTRAAAQVLAGAQVKDGGLPKSANDRPVSYTHLRAHETGRKLVCRLLLEKN